MSGWFITSTESDNRAATERGGSATSGVALARMLSTELQQAQQAATELQQAQQAVLLWCACSQLLLVLRMLNSCGLRKLATGKLLYLFFY
jgi:hypothetical protein